MPARTLSIRRILFTFCSLIMHRFCFSPYTLAVRDFRGHGPLLQFSCGVRQGCPDTTVQYLGCPLIRAAGYFQQMIAELGFDRALHRIYVGAENHLIEFRHHLPRAEGTKVATLRARRAAGVLLGDIAKIGAGFDFGFQLLTLFFAGYENVSRCCFRHGVSNRFKFCKMPAAKQVCQTDHVQYIRARLAPPPWKFEKKS